MSGGLDRTAKITIGFAGMTRAATGGMLATALTVYIGRAGSPLAVGLLGSVFFLSMMVFAPLWGSLGDAMGSRRTLLIALSGLSTGVTLGFVAVRSIPGIVGLRFVYAVFAVGVTPILLASVTALGGRRHRGRAAGFFNSSLAAGDMSGQFLVGVLLGVLAPSALYLVVACVGLLATVAVALFPRDAGVSSPAGRSVDELARAVRARLIPTAAERAVLAEQGLTWLYAGLFVRHIAIKGIGSLVPIYLVSSVGVSEVTMGTLLTLGSAAQLGFMPVSGRLADGGSRRQLILTGTVLSGVYALVLASTPTVTAGAYSLGAVAASFVLLAAGFSLLDVGVVSLLGDVAPERETTLVGLRATVTGAGGVVGPLLVGLAATALDFQSAFVGAGLLSFLSAGLVARTLREPPRQTDVTAGDRTLETPVGLPLPVRTDDADD